jgi:hypothetical protein
MKRPCTSHQQRRIKIKKQRRASITEPVPRFQIMFRLRQLYRRFSSDWQWQEGTTNQCLKVRRTEEIWTVVILPVFESLADRGIPRTVVILPVCENFEKIREIQKNSAKMQWRRLRISRILESQTLAGFVELSATDKSSTFSKNRPSDSQTNFSRNRSNFVENRSLKRKNREK